MAFGSGEPDGMDLIFCKYVSISSSIRWPSALICPNLQDPEFLRADSFATCSIILHFILNYYLFRSYGLWRPCYLLAKFEEQFRLFPIWAYFGELRQI